MERFYQKSSLLRLDLGAEDTQLLAGFRGFNVGSSKVFRENAKNVVF